MTPYDDLVLGRWPSDERTGVGQRLAELRRSSAAGKHGKRSKDRRNTKRQAIRRDIEASS